ncbi:MAG: YbjN domain-containing protein [Deltaproteobacteria bacterium]|nr:YbjN domain-containing protein [Deltaproteobacteria bacterium]
MNRIVQGLLGALLFFLILTGSENLLAQDTTGSTDSTVYTTITPNELMAIMQKEEFTVAKINDLVLEWILYDIQCLIFFTETNTSLRFYTKVTSPSADLEKVNTWNREVRYSKSYLNNDRSYILELDLDLDGGITEKRIKLFLITCEISLIQWVERVIIEDKS